MPENDYYHESNRGEEALVRILENGTGALTTLAIPRQEIPGSPEAMVLDTLGYFVSFANIFNRTFLEDNKGERQISRPELYLRAIFTGPVRATAARLAPTVIAKAIENHDFISSPWGLAFLGGVAAISLYETGRTVVNIGRKIVKPIINGINEVSKTQRERAATKEAKLLELRTKTEKRQVEKTAKEAPETKDVVPQVIALPLEASEKIRNIIKTIPAGAQRDHAIDQVIRNLKND